MGLVVGLCGRVTVSGLLALTLRETSSVHDHDTENEETTTPVKKHISGKKHKEAREKPDKHTANKSKSGVKVEA